MYWRHYIFSQHRLLLIILGKNTETRTIDNTTTWGISQIIRQFDNFNPFRENNPSKRATRSWNLFSITVDLHNLASA